MSIITFPKILNDRLTDEGARALADMFNTVESSAQKITLEIAEERFEKRVSQVEARLEAKISAVEAKISAVEARLDAKIERVAAETKAELIKWMFIFTFGQFWLIVGTLTGILFAFFKH